MRTVQDIYEAYRVMPALQLHQLRVAGCGALISRNSERKLDEKKIVLACLFHDMANIIKSDLALFPDLVEPEGEAHWQLVKDEFIKTYGTNEHHAALRIGEEIGLPEDVLDIIGHIGFSKLGHIYEQGSRELQICEYSDLRVGPHGVLSMQARIDEGTARYRLRERPVPRNGEEYEQLVATAYKIEQAVFADAAIAPEDITEAAVSELFPELRAIHVA